MKKLLFNKDFITNVKKKDTEMLYFYERSVWYWKHGLSRKKVQFHCRIWNVALQAYFTHILGG